jgi:hypothetical protein
MELNPKGIPQALLAVCRNFISKYSQDDINTFHDAADIPERTSCHKKQEESSSGRTSPPQIPVVELSNSRLFLRKDRH